MSNCLNLLASKSKLILALLIFISILAIGLYYWFYESNKIYPVIAFKHTINRISEKVDEILNEKHDDKIAGFETNNEFRLRNNGEWVVNKNILQYSAYGIFYGNKLKIESLAFLSYLTVQGYQDAFKCLVRFNKSKFKILSVIDKREILPPLNKFICELKDLKPDDLDIESEIAVAIIHEPDINFDLNFTNAELKVADQLPVHSVQFHRAKLFNGNKPKKQAVGHCVHMMYGIDSIESKEMTKFTNWVDLQKNIGIARIRLYVLNLNTTITDYLTERYKGFLTFVQHPTSYSVLCSWHKEQKEKNPGSSLHRVLFELCEKTFSKLFNPIDGGAHDRTCMNDCYLNSKYEYELFTNYDIDEIILPRNEELYELKSFESFNCDTSLDEYKPKYNIYDYGINIMNKFGRNHFHCFMFKHVAYLPIDDQLNDFFKNVENILNADKGDNVVYMESSKKSFVTYRLAKEFLQYGKKALNFHKLNQCLRKKYVNNTKMSEEFQRYFAAYFGSRWGKSIIDTNLTESINHHSCDAPVALKFDLELRFGYASHFRTHVLSFLNSATEPFPYVFTDIEYSLFLYKVLGNNL